MTPNVRYTRINMKVQDQSSGSAVEFVVRNIIIKYL